MTSTWREFWNADNSVYISEKYKEVHFAKIADDVIALLPRTRPLSLLDWGCGEALGAPRYVHAGIQIYLFDPVPLPLRHVQERFRDVPNITVLDVQAVEKLPDGSMDAIIVNSVLQYISVNEFRGLLRIFERLLSADGVLILGDVVSTDDSMVVDAWELLKAGFVYGFFTDVLFGLVRTFFSEYRLIRKKSGFTAYRESEIIDLLQKAGFRGERIRPNVGLAPQRMLFRALKSAQRIP